jgi:cyclophilin family peptidyl-prolyl cis-trans isomerase
MKVKIETNLGDIEIELNEKVTPKTVEKISSLIKKGFYDGVKFHRVIKGFMIQSGDPNTIGGPEYLWGIGGPTDASGNPEKFEDENFELSNLTGTISMANSGSNTNGSQFFINTKDNTFLDGKHVVFGKVTDETMEIVRKIENLITKENDRPINEVIINKFSVK